MNPFVAIKAKTRCFFSKKMQLKVLGSIGKYEKKKTKTFKF